MNFKILIIFIFIIFVTKLHSQVSVNGTVMDSLGKPLASVSIILKKNSGIVLAFAITNTAGGYKIQYANASAKDTLVVEANAMGYTKQKIPVTFSDQATHFIMQSTSIKLPTVTVTNSQLLRKEGDTLNYDVAAFSTQQDRTIGDVIKKLPGVEVADNGQISVGGKPINRFYIDGDNLLDGKYNIATRGIPKDMVSKVQVLENHQPVNVLKDLEKSESAAMNIVLKDKARIKIIGTGDAALGTPDVYNVTANAMLFRKQVKFINYVKMNNMGVDNSDETFNHFSGDNVQPVSILNAGTGNPDLLKKRYLFNNVGLVNVNNLINLRHDYQLRINAFYLWDRRYQSSQFSSVYFLPNDTISYAEKQNAQIINNTFNTQFTLVANKKDYYFNNVTVLENTPSRVLSDLQATSNNNIIQHLNGTITTFSNQFNIIKKFTNGHILEAYSSVSNIHNPASLQVEPGLFPAQFNNSMPYAGLTQQASVPLFNTDNYISFGRAGSIFQQQYKIGINYQDQQLNSLLESQQLNGSKSVVADSFINHLSWRRFKAYLQSDFTYTNGPVMLRLNLPLTYQDTKYTGRVVTNQFSNVLILPRVYLKLMTTKEDYLNLVYNYGDTYGEINQVYDGYVMRGYRDFYSNGTLLNELKTHFFSGAYVIKNTLKIFFFSVGGLSSWNTSNTINDLRISSLLQQSKLIPLENIFKSSQLYTTISKYVFPLMTTLWGKISWQRSVVNQLQNGELLQTQSDSYTYNYSINTKFSSWFNMDYVGTYTKFGSKPLGNEHSVRPASPKVEKWQQEFSANFTVSGNFYFKLSGDNYRYMISGSQDNNYTFADAFFTYKADKLKSNIELSITNIGGINSYKTASLSSNSIVESTYRIRPRMVMVKFYYRF